MPEQTQVSVQAQGNLYAVCVNSNLVFGEMVMDYRNWREPGCRLAYSVSGA
jgi:hypothetical protein